MNRIIYTSKQSSEFSTLPKLKQVFKLRNKPKVYNWSLKQYTHIIQTGNKNFSAQSLHTELHYCYVLEIDLVDLKSLSKHNDKVKYLMNAGDVFSKRAQFDPLLNGRGDNRGIW